MPSHIEYLGVFPTSVASFLDYSWGPYSCMGVFGTSSVQSPKNIQQGVFKRHPELLHPPSPSSSSTSIIGCYMRRNYK